MRTIEEYNKVKELADKGYNKCQISRETGIPRGTLREWLNDGFCPKVSQQKNFGEGRYIIIDPEKYLIEDKERAYAFIFGEYLGDGYIRTFPRTYRLSIYNDKKYENLNQLIEKELSIIFPNNNINRVNCQGCWEITIHNKNMLKFFPQHGKGEKWERNIVLTDWQQKIINKYPKEFIKGLFYSDGSIYIHSVGPYSFLAYNFAQKSKDITMLFINALKLIGIEKEAYYHPTREAYFIQNFNKEQRDILSTFITPKQNITI